MRSVAIGRRSGCTPPTDPQRRRLENSLAAELVPVAKRIAAAAAWKIHRPEYAEEVWGEGLALAILHQDPSRGLFLSYLSARIRGLVHELVRGSLQTGTATILRRPAPAAADSV